MTLLEGSIDLLLASALPWLAWRLLRSSDLYQAVILFIAFGLLLALVWVQLDAIDLALAEAGIGAGLSGVLLFFALARLGAAPPPATSRHSRPWAHRLLLLLPVLLALLALAATTPTASRGLAGLVQAELPASGVGHPVTAVLLNFRAYDTLLETMVLLLAVVAVWSLQLCHPLCSPAPAGGVQLGLSRILWPLLLVTASYLLWRGTSAPGGAFQAAVLLAVGGLLLTLAGEPLQPAWQEGRLRLLLAGGILVFIAAAFGSLLYSGRLLAFPPWAAGRLIFAIEAALCLSIAGLLVAVVCGCIPWGAAKDKPQEPPR
jgi:multisubunit Na+/H+ antiporter MnhB subunit